MAMDAVLFVPERVCARPVAGAAVPYKLWSGGIQEAGRTRRIAMALPQADAQLMVREMRKSLTSFGK